MTYWWASPYTDSSPSSTRKVEQMGSPQASGPADRPWGWLNREEPGTRFQLPPAKHSSAEGQPLFLCAWRRRMPHSATYGVTRRGADLVAADNLSGNALERPDPDDLISQAADLLERVALFARRQYLARQDVHRRADRSPSRITCGPQVLPKQMPAVSMPAGW
jgi:hypothetical protein